VVASGWKENDKLIGVTRLNSLLILSLLRVVEGESSIKLMDKDNIYLNKQGILSKLKSGECNEVTAEWTLLQRALDE